MKSTHHVALVPKWLAEHLNANQMPLSVVTDFQKLSSVVSLQDVCFYIATQEHLSLYVGNHFDDMESVVKAPQNQLWLTENSGAVVRARELLTSSIPKELEMLTSQSTPKSIRKTDYEARPTDTNCLVLVGVGAADQYDHVSFIDKCVKALHQQLTVSQYQQFDVFKTFTQVTI